MVFRFKILLAALFVLGFFTVNAKDSDYYRAKSILLKSKEITQKSNFKSHYKQGTDSTVIYHRFTSDGIILERIENTSKKNLPEVIITNKGGVYAFIGENKIRKIDDIIKVDFQSEALWSSYLIDINEDMDGSFSKSNSSFNDISCYKITVNVSKDVLKRAKSAGKTIAALATVRVYLVGKRNHFIYACSYYNGQGKVIFNARMGKVEFNVPMANSLFELPNLENIHVAKDMRDVQNVADKLNPNRPSIFTRIGKSIWNGICYCVVAPVNFVDNNFSDITTWASIILFWVSILCVLIVIVVKIKK